MFKKKAFFVLCVFIMLPLNWVNSFFVKEAQIYHSKAEKSAQKHSQSPQNEIERIENFTLDDKRFQGVERLYGTDGFEKLKKAHVCITGLGGVGSWAAEALARSGIGKLTFIDLDDICTSNINRQVVAVTSTVGQQKIDVLKKRVLEINPKCQVNLVLDFLTSKNIHQILTTDFDCVLDCMDSVIDKCFLIDACRNLTIPVVTVGAAGGKKDPTQVKVVDITRAEYDDLLFMVRKHLRQYHNFPRGTKSRPVGKKWGVASVYSTEIAQKSQNCEISSLRKCDAGFGTAAFVTGTFGLLAAGTVCKLIVEDDFSLKWSDHAIRWRDEMKTEAPSGCD